MKSAQIYNSWEGDICVVLAKLLTRLLVFINTNWFGTTNSTSEFYFKVEFPSGRAKKEIL